MLGPVWSGSTTAIPDSVLRLENVIYKFTSPIGKAYIGKTKNLYKRFCNYKNVYKNALGTAIYRAIVKYGFENFEFTILAKFKTASLLDAAEIIAIWAEKTRAPNGYNLTIGGDGVSNPTDETRARMSKAQSGKIYSAETRAKISRAHVGMKHTAEAKAKVSKATLGKKRSMETLEKKSKVARRIHIGIDLPTYNTLYKRDGLEHGVRVTKPGYAFKNFSMNATLPERIELAKEYLRSLDMDNKNNNETS